MEEIISNCHHPKNTANRYYHQHFIILKLRRHVFDSAQFSGIFFWIRTATLVSRGAKCEYERSMRVQAVRGEKVQQ